MSGSRETVVSKTDKVPTLMFYSTNDFKKSSSSGLNDIEINRFSNIYGVITGRTASGTDAVPTNTLNSTELFRIGAGGYANGGFTPTRASIGFWTSESWTTTANGSRIVFSTTNNNSALQTGKMLIDHDGKVGIGIMTPLARLHVSGAETEKLRLENTAALGTGINSEMYFKTGNYFTGGIKTIGVAAQSARMGLFTFAGTNSQDLLERISTTDGGNVGINTTNPSDKHHVVGNTKLDGPTIIGTSGTQLKSVSKVNFIHNIPNVVGNTFYSFEIPLTNPISISDGLFINTSASLEVLQTCWVRYKNANTVEVQMYNAWANDYDPSSMEYYLTIINWN